MQLKILGSSSKGNCYILETDSEILLIECGVNINKIMRSIGFNTTKVKGCLISHEHGDHCNAAKDVLKAGINIYASAGTIKGMEKCGVRNDHHCVHEVKAKKLFQIGSFKILPFDVKHDALEPMCFLIEHEECGKVLFITDTYYVQYTFPGLNNILVEANFSQEIIDRRLVNGESPEFLRNRIFKSHMSLDTCKELLKANDLSAVNNIVLIHLSDNNSNAVEFQKAIQDLTGKTVTVADVGVTIENFNKQPF